jgi:FMN phosphatase YigB (HAD superfamily)
MLIISIDLWGTLIKSSPDFVDAKVALTKKYFDIEPEKILKAYSDTKKELNSLIEQTGTQPSTDLMFGLLFSKLNGGYCTHGCISDKFIDEYQKLALDIPPIIYSNETIPYLAELYKIGKLHISSNTMLISGDSLGHILGTRKLDHYFDHFLFSDQVGKSKPHSRMYGYSNFHIGDNEITDGAGPKLINSTPIIINSNNKTIKDAYDFIVQNR